MVSGQLQLRGADPFSLASPTTISGTNTDGQLSGVTLATPTVTTTRDVPDYNTTATIDASFSMVEPGVGSINEQRNMTVQVKLAVDLRIVVPLLAGSSTCRSEPIVLTLTSTAPHDEETGRVTLRAPNFSVPGIVASPGCNGLLVEPVNDAIAGAGHTLTLTMQGPLTAPPEGEPTATTLAVSPAGSSDLGDDVTLTATVTPNPAVPDAPPISGVVDFRNDGTSIGTAEVQEDGTATLTTPDLPAGPLQLQAVYGGAPPDWDPSTSAVVPHSVIAPPFVTTTASGEVRIGGTAKDFDVTVHNTGFGADLEDARLEVTIKRHQGTNPIGPNGPTDRIVLSRVVGGVPTQIPLTFAASSLSGEVADSTVWSLPVGEEHTETLRLQVNSGTDVGPLAVGFALVAGTAPKVTLATTTGVVTMVTDARLPSTIESGTPAIPPFFPAGVPVTTRVRQGNVAELNNLRVTSGVGGVAPSGAWTIAVDGVPVQAQHTDLQKPGAFQWANSVPLSTSAPGVLIKIPRTVPTGTHQVTVRFSGNSIYAPAQRTWPITIEEAIGTLYDCVASSVNPVKFTANVEVEGALPTTWAVGQPLPIDRMQVRLRISRTSSQANVMASINGTGKDWRLELAPGGTITPATVTSSSSGVMTPTDVGPTDHTINLNNGTGTLTVDATPGTDDTYTLDAINVTATPSGFSTGLLCEPADQAHAIGTVTSAGTTLTADRSGPVAAGTPVALTATALPVTPGIVEFRDGTTTIGVIPVDGLGAARMTTDDLPAGIRSLTARFFGGVVATSPSPAVALRVVDECLPLDEGSGAVVRLTYMELLGRCPDAAGYAFWVGRLDGGMTAEGFARTIARTPEAVGRIVDDAYRTMLGRPADSAGRAFWTGRLLAHGRYDQLLADLGASPEFWSLAGSTNTGFVTRVYERLLDRSPEQAGLDYWVGRLDAGVSPRVLILTLANLDEPLGVLVADSYGEILDRAPDATERTAGIGHLRSTGDRSGLYAQLIGTGEFAIRAGTFPTSEP